MHWGTEQKTISVHVDDTATGLDDIKWWSVVSTVGNGRKLPETPRRGMVSRTQERWRRETTDGRTTTYSKRERPISEYHSVSRDYPRGQCQFIGCSIVVVIVLSSLRAARLNGLMRMRRARYFFFRARAECPSGKSASPRCDAKWISDASERNIARTHTQTHLLCRSKRSPL